jgi:DNA mismatch endonuclease (patch repair protein)
MKLQTKPVAVMNSGAPPKRRKKAGHRSWAPGNSPVPGRHRGDIMSPEKRSAVMSRIRGHNTTPELLIFAEMKRRRVNFTTHARDLPGRPDIVFRRLRLAVFIDGDFWHGWRFPLWRHKLSKRWREKIAANRKRDSCNFRKLRCLGWMVLRIWEHQVESAPQVCVDRILAARMSRLAALATRNGAQSPRLAAT